MNIGIRNTLRFCTLGMRDQSFLCFGITHVGAGFLEYYKFHLEYLIF